MTAALDVERTQLAAKLAVAKLRALSANKTSASAVPKEPTQDLKTKPRAAGKRPSASDPFKGKRSSTWREVSVSHVLQNIRGDVSPAALCKELGIAESVLRRRVIDIIGNPDPGKRWQKGVGYLVKRKPAWDHEQGTLRVDKTKGAAMAALADVSAKGIQPADKSAAGRKASPGPTDEELSAYVAGKVTVAKLLKKYKCGKGKIYRAISDFKVRFGADAPHGSGSNGVKKSPSNGVASPAAQAMSN